MNTSPKEVPGSLTVHGFRLAFAAVFLTLAISGCKDTLRPEVDPSDTPELTPELKIVTQPQGAQIEGELSRQPVLEIRNKAGALMTGDHTTVVTAEVTSPNGTLEGQTSVNASGGVVAFADLRISGRVGEYSLRFSAPAMESVTSETFAMDPPVGLVPFDTVHLVSTGQAGMLTTVNELLLEVSVGTRLGAVDSLIAVEEGSIIGSFRVPNAPIAFYQVALPIDTPENLAEVARHLESDSRVLSASPRYLIQPDNLVHPGLDNDQLSAARRFAYSRVRLTPAWWMIANAGPSLDPVRVGIIDTGLNMHHPEFSEPLKVHGRNLLVGNESDWADQDGHGTLVAGIVAARNDGTGMTGVLGPAAGDYELWIYRVGNVYKVPENLRKRLKCRLFGLLGYKGCLLLDTWAIQAAERLAIHTDHIDVLNMSFGQRDCLTEDQLRNEQSRLQRLLDESPVRTIVVRSAGNAGIDAACTRPTDEFHPRYFLVGGTNAADGRYDSSSDRSSNFGDLTLAAPYEVFSTDLSENDPAYTMCRGTSCSTPLVTGTVALLRQLGVDPDGIKSMLRETGEPIETDQGLWTLLDIGKAVKSALGLESFPFYASSGHGLRDPPSSLYLVYPAAEGVDLEIGTIRTPSGFEPVITDLAEAPDGTLWGVSYDVLYRIDRTNAGAERVGALGVSGVNALEFYGDGTLYAANLTQTPFVATGWLYRVDLETGAATEVGRLASNLGSSGDLALAPDGTLFGAVRNLFGRNYLARIDVATGQATRVASRNEIGFGNVFGLRFVGDTLFGLTAGDNGNGILLTIDTETGRGSLVRSLGFKAFGSTVSGPHHQPDQ